MLILGIDTTGRSLSVALVQGRELLGEITLKAARGQAGLVMEAIAKLLDLSGLDPQSLDGVAVTKGPGGFSGVRLGVSIAKGLCMGLEKPVAGVSSLECLAFQAQAPGFTTWAVLDCLKNEVYAASYAFGAEKPAELAPPAIYGPFDLASGLSGPCILVGDGALRHGGVFSQVKGASFAQASNHLIRASSAAILGGAILPGAGRRSADHLVPFYLRASDARLPERPLRPANT